MKIAIVQYIVVVTFLAIVSFTLAGCATNAADDYAESLAFQKEFCARRPGMKNCEAFIAQAELNRLKANRESWERAMDRVTSQ